MTNEDSGEEGLLLAERVGGVGGQMCFPLCPGPDTIWVGVGSSGIDCSGSAIRGSGVWQGILPSAEKPQSGTLVAPVSRGSGEKLTGQPLLRMPVPGVGSPWRPLEVEDVLLCLKQVRGLTWGMRGGVSEGTEVTGHGLQTRDGSGSGRLSGRMEME